MSKSPERLTYTSTPLPSLDAEWASLIRRLGLAALTAIATTTTGLALSLYGRIPFLRPLAIGLLFGSLVLLALALAGVIAALWQDIERITQRDLDRSGAVGDGLVLLRARNAPDADAELADAFADFVTACAAGGASTGSRRWEPTLGRTRYAAWRDKLLSAGFAKWRSTDPRTGWDLTATPDEIIQALG